jgi:hypothetical protein
MKRERIYRQALLLACRSAPKPLKPCKIGNTVLCPGKAMADCAQCAKDYFIAKAITQG